MDWSLICLIVLFPLVYSQNQLMVTNVESSSDDESNTIRENKKSDFVPTEEWQEVTSDTLLPSGLHYRINFQTGKKEAKILESIAKINDDSAFKEIKKENANFSLPQNNQDIDIIQYLQNAFDINMNKLEDQLLILEDLEYLMHQIDNANDFITIGGVEKVILPCLNSEKNLIKMNTLSMLGALLQNNPKAKMKLLTYQSVFPKLLILLNEDSDLNVRLKSVYALSNWIRNHAPTYETFLALHGFETFYRVLSSQDNSKLKVKILNLLADLLQEEENRDSLVSLLDATALCPRIVETFFEDQTFGFVENLVDIILGFTLIPQCQKHFSRSEPLMSELMTLTLLKDAKHQELVNKIHTLISKLNRQIKREL